MLWPRQKSLAVLHYSNFSFFGKENPYGIDNIVSCQIIANRSASTGSIVYGRYVVDVGNRSLQGKASTVCNASFRTLLYLVIEYRSDS